MKQTLGEKIFGVFNALILALIAILCLLPVYHVLCASVSDPAALSAHKGLVLHPLGGATLEGYGLIFQNSNLVRSYANTIFYVVTATMLGIVLTSMAAYVLSRSGLMLGGILTFLIAFTMLFSGGLIPTYMVVKNLHLVDTPWAVILPKCMSVFNIMIMRTSFKGLPDGLEEAARIDGAGPFRIFVSIVLPVSKAILAVVVLFYAVYHWNSWFNASIYLKDRKLYPLQLLLREIVIQNQTSSLEDFGDPGAMNLSRLLVKYGVIMVSILPMMVIYPFVQKYFVTGVMIGSIKG